NLEAANCGLSCKGKSSACARRATAAKPIATSNAVIAQTTRRKGGSEVAEVDEFGARFVMWWPRPTDPPAFRRTEAARNLSSSATQNRGNRGIEGSIFGNRILS